MTTAEFWTYLAIALTGIVLSAIFSGLEIALYTINRVRLTVRAARGVRSARWLRAEMQDSGRTLATLLLGNNIANYAGSFGIAALLAGWGFTAAETIFLNAAILIPVLFVFGETLPKDLFRLHTDRWSYRWAGFLRSVRVLLTWVGLLPIVRAFGAVLQKLMGGAATSGLRTQYVSQLIKEGVGAGVISETQTTLADRALALRQRTVAAEMIAWANVVSAPLTLGPHERDGLLRKRDFSRFPVVDADGRVVGLLSLIDAALHRDRSTGDLMTDPFFLPPTMPVREAMRDMRARRHTMAIVGDPESPRPLGIVTLKDLVEPLIGDLAAW